MSKWITVIFLMILLPGLLKSQTFDPVNTLKQYVSEPGEKIYVHLDKTEYIVGEKIQYKAFVLSGLQLSDQSTNIYVELMDPTKNVVYRNVIPVLEGISFGSFVIPEHLPENSYYFRAYTRWMLNWDDRLNCLEPIKIYNPASKSRLIKSSIKYKPEIHIESDYLTDSLPANVVIRLNAEGMLPAKWSGFLYEKSKSSEIILSFKNLNEEFSSFRFIPYYGFNYAVKFVDDHGIEWNMDLPPVQKSGIDFQVLNLDSMVMFNLMANRQSLKNYRILAHANGEIIFNEIVRSDYSRFSGRIKMDNICVGIIHFSVFDAEGNCLIERMVFPNIKKVKAHQPKLEFNKINDQSGGINELEMIMDSKGGNYLIQVIKDLASRDHSDWNLLCALYFGDLLKRPYHATSYFSDSTFQASAALDALMISEQWSRFQWKDVSNGKMLDKIFKHDYFLSFTGQIARNYKMLTNREFTVYIESEDLKQSFAVVKTDSVGNFVLDGQYFYDTARLFFMDNKTGTFPKDLEVTMRRNLSFRPFIGNLPLPLYIAIDRTDADSVLPRVAFYSEFVEMVKKEREKIDMLKKYALTSASDYDYLTSFGEFSAASISGYEVVKHESQLTSSSLKQKDLRSVLYWNPWINPQNRFPFSFTNSDFPGEIKINIIGLNREGQPVLLEKVL